VALVEKLTSRPALTDDDARRLFLALVPMHAEVGRAPMNPDKAFVWVYSAIKDGAVYVVETEAGAIVGSVGLLEADMGYSDTTYLRERWFYIAPGYRDGRALRLLLGEVKRLVDDTGLMAMVKVFNERRFGKADASQIAKVARDLCYYPAGDILEIEPRGS